MDYIIDACIAAVFVLIVILGAKNGFVKTFLGIVAAVGTLFAAESLSRLLAPRVYERFFSQKVYDTIRLTLEKQTGGASSGQKAKAVLDVIPESFSSLTRFIGIDPSEIGNRVNDLGNKGKDAAAEIAAGVAAPLFTALLHAVLFAVLAVLLFFLFKIIIGIIDRVFKLPVLKTANKLLGAVLGILKGVVVGVMLCVVLKVTAGMLTGSAFAKAVEASRIIGFVADNGLVLERFRI